MAKRRGTIGNHFTLRKFQALPTTEHEEWNKCFHRHGLFKIVGLLLTAVTDHNPTIHTTPSRPRTKVLSYTFLLRSDLCRDQTREPLKMS